MEKRLKLGSALLRFGRKRKGRMLEVFPAEQWPDKPEADTGLFRLSIDGKWWMPGGRRYAFITREALVRLLADEICKPGTLAAYEQRRPELRKGDRCRWRPDDVECGQVQVTLFSDPVLWVDGLWRALIVDREAGTRLVACEELTLLDHLGRELCRLPEREG
jgi:hypothetical protein